MKIDIKYSIGDTAYTMSGNQIKKVEVINFSLASYQDKDKPVEGRIKYEVQDVKTLRNSTVHLLTLSIGNVIDKYKGLDELFDTADEVFNSLRNKFKEYNEI